MPRYGSNAAFSVDLLAATCVSATEPYRPSGVPHARPVVADLLVMHDWIVGLDAETEICGDKPPVADSTV